MRGRERGRGAVVVDSQLECDFLPGIYCKQRGGIMDTKARGIGRESGRTVEKAAVGHWQGVGRALVERW